jgi:hypothetical protein
MKTIFLRALDEENKADALLAAVRQPDTAHGKRRFEVDPGSFAQVNGSPFCYWVSERIRNLFKTLPPFENDSRLVRQGGVTGNDARYLRTAWEVEAQTKRAGPRWVPFAKGGNASPWYADYPVVVAWDDRRVTFFGYTGLLHRASEKPSSADHYFHPGLTWPLRAARFAPVPLPRNSVFSIRGYAILAPEDKLLSLGAVGNSTLFDYIFKVALGRFGFPEFVVGVLQKIPLPEIPSATDRLLSQAARRAWSLRRGLDTSVEISRAFVLPVAMQSQSVSIYVAVEDWTKRMRAVENELGKIQTEIDNWCFELYGISEIDRRSISDALSIEEDKPAQLEEVDSESEIEDTTAEIVDAGSIAADLVSWAVGVAVGRFDINLATGTRRPPAEPGPFDPLPVCSPAMLTGEDGAPLASAPIGYPVSFPTNGILVDDPGHARDLTAALRVVFDEAFKTSADAWWGDVAALLDPKGRDLRTWLASGFFGHHLKRHSKSRRKAPIVWQLAVPSGRYSVWLYAHRLSRDSFIQIQNDVVTPKLAHEEHQLASLLSANPTSKERKEVEAQETFVDELRELLDEVKRVAPLWHPSFDDGVALTMAPLWRLVPQHKPWQKELKSKWDELVAGKYDWAHIAMHLWPERVIPKCAQDRSVAISHGLEGTFWFEGEDGKWKPYEKPQKPIADLVRERTSPAVKAALKSLLDAPEPASGAKRSRKAKAA